MQNDSSWWLTLWFPRWSMQNIYPSNSKSFALYWSYKMQNVSKIIKMSYSAYIMPTWKIIYHLKRVSNFFKDWPIKNRFDCHLLIHYSSFDGENFADTEDSQYWHGGQKIGNYRGKAFVTSCEYANYRDFCNRYTELLDMESLTWSTGAEYPSDFARFILLIRFCLNVYLVQLKVIRWLIQPMQYTLLEDIQPRRQIS